MANLALHPEFGHADGDTFQILLDEQQMTENALKHLGLTKDLDLQNVKDLNKVVLPRKYNRDSKKPIAVHFMGMPRAGKSTFVQHLAEVARILNWSIGVMPETAGPLKEISDKHQERFSYKTYDTSLAIVHAVENFLLKKQFEKLKEPDMVLIDRGVLDRISFTKANFSFGRLDASKFAASLSNIEGGLSQLKDDFNIAIMLMLITPEESIKREGGKHGRVMNPPFLKNLYEQYLRFHWEIIQISQEQGLTFPYVCLDMSNSREINANLVAEKFGEIALFYYPKLA